MNKAEKFHKQVLKEMKTYSHKKHKYLFNLADKEKDEYYHEIFGGTKVHPREGPYYKYMACVVKLIQPKIVVEIGGDIGASALCMYSELPEDGFIYTCDICQDYRWIPEELITKSKIRKVIGNSINVEWPHYLDLSEAKVWLIDGDHASGQVEKEINRYSKYWKKGTVVMFDDVKQYRKVFYNTRFDKLCDPSVHRGGFGIYVI